MIHRIESENPSILYYYLSGINQYANFRGRARRKEYWFFFLFNLLLAFIIGFLDNFFGLSGWASILYGLFILIPGVSVTVRRLHDTGRSWWWILITLLPIIGLLTLIYFLAQEGLDKPKKYAQSY